MAVLTFVDLFMILLLSEHLGLWVDAFISFGTRLNIVAICSIPASLLPVMQTEVVLKFSVGSPDSSVLLSHHWLPLQVLGLDLSNVAMSPVQAQVETLPPLLSAWGILGPHPDLTLQE